MDVTMRPAACLVLAAAILAGTATAQTRPPTQGNAAGLEQARRNYPPLILGSNTEPTDGTGPGPLPCPAAGARVEQRGAPALEFLGPSPANPELCRMRVAGQAMEAWFGIWATAWPGADQAYPAMRRAIRGPTGTVEAFDTVMGPGAQWHDLIRNEGIETIRLLDKTYRAMKLSHYREGYDGNTYRSVSTVWKDMATGLLIYGTYQHIAGRPEIDDPLIPTAIIPAP